MIGTNVIQRHLGVQLRNTAPTSRTQQNGYLLQCRHEQTPPSVSSQGQQLPGGSRMMKDDSLPAVNTFEVGAGGVDCCTRCSLLAFHGENRAARSFQASDALCEKLADTFREFCIPCNRTPPVCRGRTLLLGQGKRTRNKRSPA